MRVLLLAPNLPSPTGSGAAIRDWQVLQHLAERHATVHVVALEAAHTTSDPPLPPNITLEAMAVPRRRRGRRLVTLLTSRRPDLAQRLWSPGVAAHLQRLVAERQYDVLHLAGLETACYAPALARRPAPRPAIVLDEFNAEYLLQERAWQVDRRRPRTWPLAVYSWLQVQRLRRFETSAARLADGLLCVSAADAAALASLDARLRPQVLPNGVDTVRYAPWAGEPTTLPRHDLVFSGTMDYRPNVDAALWFVHHVWPVLQQARPHLTLALVGQRPGPPMQALGRWPGVTVTGAVPDDRPYLWGAGAYVVPMRFGGGSRLKVLNALAQGVPVVSTSQGADGVEAMPERDFLLADSPADWARQVDRLLGDEATRQRLAAAGRTLVLERYQWRHLMATLDRVYDHALATAQGGQH